MRPTFKVLTREEIMANRSSAYKFIDMSEEGLKNRESGIFDIVNGIKEIKKQEGELFSARLALQKALIKLSPLQPGDKVDYRGELGFIQSIKVVISGESNFEYRILKMKKDGTPSKQSLTWWATELNTKLYGDV